ncbi:MAG: hypothetical protein ACR2NX_13105 [Chthoniobacterales bacterium]
MTNLNDLIGSAAKQYTVVSATGINDQGQIVANALDNQSGLYRALLLTPSDADPLVLPPVLPPVSKKMQVKR